ncbi:choice-of-anchor tandem repeat GloVer-containing protein [Roseivirga sp. E12]|uniref:choice-of-anchor tandem repeat GloVer-containing protein n=1 Tax=Roseivirga sp. E12 TaxID=2819237 RepID=UPI001ABC676C|nr:choice-of-anchor tandem repeat GloVer-containing protein [Roseivirga sp. E12]
MNRCTSKRFLCCLLLSICQVGLSQNVQLWSVTSNNGAHGYGSIFHIENNGTGFTKVHDFTGEHGYPFASLTLSNGKLWGMTMGRTGSPTAQETRGHGAIFNLDLTGSNFKVIHVFDGVNGSMPLGELTENDGKLWGMTNRGGQHDQGVIFSLDLETNRFQKVYDFNQANGSNPRNSLLVHEDKFWGTTSRGGGQGVGVIFSLNLDGTGYQKVYDFQKENGGEPESGLTLFEGKLWGMTARGGKNNEGTVYYLNPEDNSLVSVHDLEYPALGELNADSEKLWGMMALRGENNAGTVFTIEDEEHLVVHHFDKANGRFPEGNLMEYEGVMWGMTRFGGMNNLGVIFTIDKASGHFKKIFDFNKESGGVPYGSFVEVSRKK